MLSARLSLLAVAMVLALGLAAPTLAAQHAALVIGNDRYPNLPADQQLTRAASDATAVAQKLTSLGYQVVVRTNASRSQMAQPWIRRRGLWTGVVRWWCSPATGWRSTVATI